MDYLKNTLEELVISRVEKSFAENPEMCQCLQCKKDVTVYVLNNIKPRYIISTRGMLHEENNIEGKEKVDEEINTLLPEGMQRVKDHQRPNFDHKESDGDLMDVVGKTERFTMTEDYNYNFPFFIGEIFDNTDKEVSGAKVTLKADGEILAGWDGNWPNPYETSDKTGGKFAFWPKAVKADSDAASTYKEFKFILVITHADFQTKEISFVIKMETQKYIINFVRKDYTKNMEKLVLDNK